MTEHESGGFWRQFTVRNWRVAWGYVAALLLIVLADPTLGSIIGGLPLLLIGEAIRIVANGSLIKDKALTDFGVYAHVRHPLYVGSALIGAGFLVMAQSLILVALFLVVFVGLYRHTILREEAKMERLYGDACRQWAASTPRFFPRRLAPGEIRARFTFRKAWVNREHQGLLGVTALTAVLYLKHLGLFERLLG
jgi:protein-S-isoprenylcysteine O-methyltransferase Ste14